MSSVPQNMDNNGEDTSNTSHNKYYSIYILPHPIEFEQYTVVPNRAIEGFQQTVDTLQADIDGCWEINDTTRERMSERIAALRQAFDDKGETSA